VDIQGQILRAGLDGTDSRYCQLVQGRLGLKSRCDAENRDGLEGALSGIRTCYECHAGLTEAVLPVRNEGHVLGYVMIGQFRSRRSPPKDVAQLWMSKRNNNQLRNAFRELPRVSQEQLESTLALFSTLVDYIVAKHMVSLEGDSCVVSALDYMRSRISEPVSLDDVAKHLGVSRFTLSHAFRKHLDTSFKQSQIEMKLLRAEEILSSSPETTVSDAAEQVGYVDPYYFSRLYRSHRGYPPSTFVERHRGTSSR